MEDNAKDCGASPNRFSCSAADPWKGSAGGGFGLLSAVSSSGNKQGPSQSAAEVVRLPKDPNKLAVVKTRLLLISELKKAENGKPRSIGGPLGVDQRQHGNQLWRPEGSLMEVNDGRNFTLLYILELIYLVLGSRISNIAGKFPEWLSTDEEVPFEFQLCADPCCHKEVQPLP